MMDSPWQVKLIGRDLKPAPLAAVKAALDEAGYRVTQVLDDANQLIPEETRKASGGVPTLATPEGGAFTLVLLSSLHRGAFGWSSGPGALSREASPELIDGMLQGLLEGQLWLKEMEKVQ